MRNKAFGLVLLLCMALFTGHVWTRFLDRIAAVQTSDTLGTVNSFLDQLQSLPLVPTIFKLVCLLVTLAIALAVLLPAETRRRQNRSRSHPADKTDKATSSLSKERLAKAAGKYEMKGGDPMANIDGASAAAAFLALGGHEERPKKIPGWALLFRSPFATPMESTSWLGGVPHAPGDFSWPVDRDGKPLYFFAQIDLASLRPEPQTGARPRGLPASGALLVFGGKSFACRLLDANQMREAAPVPLPENLAPIRELDFWNYDGDRTFYRRPVDPVAYLDDGAGRPAFLPPRFERPIEWITTWGLAQFEADIVLDEFRTALGLAELDIRRRSERDGNQATEPPHVTKKFQHAELLLTKGPAVISALEELKQASLGHDPQDGVDAMLLGEVLRQRMALADEMDSYAIRFTLRGGAKKVWERLCQTFPNMVKTGDFGTLPAGYHAFVEAWVTDWRGHRLFGLEPPFGNNFEDFRGQDCVISIAADDLLCTRIEHYYGMSVWCPRDRIAMGLFDRGQFVLHVAV